MGSGEATPLTIYLIAGEESGDQLGAKLMPALRARFAPRQIRFVGVGGHAMEAQGLKSLFPLSEIAVMGFSAVIAKLPSLLRRIREASRSVLAEKPDCLVIIDSPDFTHRVARRVRRVNPALKIVNYVSPSVWAWRPKRAPRMRAYVNRVLALKPFEPEALARLNGPPCTYVGHPLVERVNELRPGPGERRPLDEAPTTLLVMPGSRRGEITRLMQPFGDTLALLAASLPHEFEVLLPAVEHLAPEIERLAAAWPVKPQILRGEAEKHAGFRRANVALVASGTATLEMALAGIPMVVGYKVSKLEEQARHLIKVPSIVLANLILGENVVPERLQWDCTPQMLQQALLPLFSDTPERRRQIEAFRRLDAIMEIGGPAPSDRAAQAIAEVMGRS